MKPIAVAVAVLAALASASLAHGRPPSDGWFVTSDGIRLHYLRLGNHGSPVVLFHGFAGDAYGNWVSTRVAEELARRHRVFALDQRGHGASDKPHDPVVYGIVRLSMDGVEFLDAVGIRRAHLVGYSMGGSVVQGVVLLAPDRAITATFGGSGSPEVDPKLARAAADLDPKGADPAERGALAAFLAQSGRDEAALNALQQAPLPPAGTPNFEPSAVRLPMLAVVGEFDMPYSKTERMRREAPDFRRVILTGRGHITAPSDPAFGAAIVSFINAHDHGFDVQPR